MRSCLFKYRDQTRCACVVVASGHHSEVTFFDDPDASSRTTHAPRPANPLLMRSLFNLWNSIPASQSYGYCH
jgi:hypothetical protein